MADLSTARRLVGPRGLYDLPIVGSCALHPSRRTVAYTVTRLDEESNAYKGVLKIVDLDTQESVALTDGSARDQLPQWSADGTAMYFASDRTGGMQLWHICAAGGDPKPLPALPGNVSELAVSPDGARIAAVATPTKGKELVERQGWRRITRIRYRSDGSNYLDDRPQVFVIDLATRAIVQVTDGSGFVAGVAWSPDGGRLAFCADHGADADSLWRRELWTASADDKFKAVQILRFPTAIEAPAWSPDGKHIAFCGLAEKSGGGGSHNVRAFVSDALGKDAACWTGDEEWTCGNYVLTDVGAAGSLLPPVWMAPDAFAVLGSSHGAARVFRVCPDKPAEALTPQNASVSHFACEPDGAVVCCASDQTTPPELYLCSKGRALRVSWETKPWCERIKAAKPQPYRVHSAGWEIESWHLQGSGDAPRPCILAIHGGPHFAYGYAFVYHFIALAEAGFDVVFCNPRGSQSYGERFARAIAGDWARPAFDDCMAALDAAIARGGIDASRLGVTGGSYGGYLTVWVVAHSDRFAAAVALRPATSLQSLWGTSEVGRMLGEDFGGSPDAAREVYERDSPLTHARAIQTPLLLIYGSQDWRTPAEQSEQLLTALLHRGATVEGLHFPNADHNLSRNGAPRQRIAHEEAILEWFQRFLM